MDDRDADDEPVEVDPVVGRLSYAPESVDLERALALLEEAGQEDRLKIAAGIGALSASEVDAFLGSEEGALPASERDALPASERDALADAVPVLVEELNRDPGPEGRKHLLRALATIAERAPAAVRPATTRVVEELTAYNYWVAEAATDVLEGVVVAFPEVARTVEPLLDHDDKLAQARAAAVFAAGANRGHTYDRSVLADCLALVGANHPGRGPALEVLANAGWTDPHALLPGVEALVEAARTTTPPACGAALSALSHVGGTRPEAVRSAVPLFVDLATADHRATSRAASALLVTVVLQEPSTRERVRALVASKPRADRIAFVRATAAASGGLPGRELSFAAFLDDESGYVRFWAVRACSPRTDDRWDPRAGPAGSSRGQ